MYDPLTSTSLETFISSRLPTFGQAVHQAHQTHQAPYALCLMSALTAVSTSCQGLIDVKLPSGPRVPSSLALLALAPSGERKSSVGKLFMGPVMGFDTVLAEGYEEELKEYRSDLSTWKAIKKDIDLRLRRCPGFEGEREAIEAELHEHYAAEPVEPAFRKLLYEDASPAAMLEGLARTGIGVLSSTEGSMVVDGKAMDSVPHLNSIWSGDTVTIDRSRKQPLRLIEARLTISLMIQPGAFDPRNGKKSEKIRESGHWARYLVFSPQSMQGARLLRNKGSGSEHIQAFSKRITQLLAELDDAMMDRDHRRRVVEFSPEAADAWMAKYDQIESQITKGGYYEHAADHASKLADNVARVAALLHYFEYSSDRISKDTLDVAMMICDQCSRDYIGIFSREPQEISDAKELLAMLGRYRDHGMQYVLKNKARQECPNKMRANGRFSQALDVLCANGHVNVLVGSDGKTYIVFPRPLTIGQDIYTIANSMFRS